MVTVTFRKERSIMGSELHNEMIHRQRPHPQTGETRPQNKDGQTDR